MSEQPAHRPDPMDTGIPRAAQASAWLLYGLIVLEILFMVSPLAAYYYAVYAAPLNALASSPRTAWLTQQMLPHFSHSDSALVNGLLLLAWPLILIGLGLFLWGCARVYPARLMGRGPVTVGLYRHIRHPQYVALAIVGLGTTLYWSRFLVVIAYVTMLWLYGALARLEERRCIARFGAAYAAYLERTGRFLPRSVELAGRRMAARLPAVRARHARTILALLLYVVCLTVAVIAGTALRQHALASLSVAQAGPHLVLFLAPLAPTDRDIVASLVRQAGGAVPRLAYVAPAHWSVPELGLVGVPGGSQFPAGELAHPASHGNRGGYDRRRIHVLIAAPSPAGMAASGRAMLGRAIRIQPEARLAIDLDTATVTDREPAHPGRWRHIPVPAF